MNNLHPIQYKYFIAFCQSLTQQPDKGEQKEFKKSTEPSHKGHTSRKIQRIPKLLCIVRNRTFRFKKEKLVLRFCHEMCKKWKSFHIFPENIKPHSMDTRKKDIYKVKHSITAPPHCRQNVVVLLLLHAALSNKENKIQDKKKNKICGWTPNISS